LRFLSPTRPSFESQFFTRTTLCHQLNFAKLETTRLLVMMFSSFPLMFQSKFRAEIVPEQEKDPSFVQACSVLNIIILT